MFIAVCNEYVEGGKTFCSEIFSLLLCGLQSGLALSENLTLLLLGTQYDREVLGILVPHGHNEFQWYYSY